MKGVKTISKYKVGDKVVMEITGISKHGGCHATCEPYKDYKIKHEAEKAEEISRNANI